jgi:hypothetical protein
MADTKPTPATVRKEAPAPTPAQAAAENPAPSVPAGSNADATTTVLAAAMRRAEIAQLTKERDELRKKLGEAPTLLMLRAEVEALRNVAARSGVTLGRQRMSAGVASDLELHGHAIDPANGDAYVRDGDRVTVTKRGTGETRTVDMPQPATSPVRE